MQWGDLRALKVSSVMAVTAAPVSILNGTYITPSRTVTVHADMALLFTGSRIAELRFTLGAVLFLEKHSAL